MLCSSRRASGFWPRPQAPRANAIAHEYCVAARMPTGHYLESYFSSVTGPATVDEPYAKLTNVSCARRQPASWPAVTGQSRRSLALIRTFSTRQDFEKVVGRTGFEPVTSSVSEKSRTVPGVCHCRTESNWEPSTWANILNRSGRVEGRLIALAPICGSHGLLEGQEPFKCCTDLVHLGARSAAGITGHRGTVSTQEASKFCMSRRTDLPWGSGWLKDAQMLRISAGLVICLAAGRDCRLRDGSGASFGFRGAYGRSREGSKPRHAAWRLGRRARQCRVVIRLP
jgi:hypothetical protein